MRGQARLDGLRAELASAEHRINETKNRPAAIKGMEAVIKKMCTTVFADASKTLKSKAPAALATWEATCQVKMWKFGKGGGGGGLKK